MEQTTTRSAAIRDGLGVGLAVGLSGVAFGAAAVTAGLDVAQACVLSLLTFTGASQFALTGAVGAGGDLVSATAGALLLGSRNTLYGLRLADLLKVRGRAGWPPRTASSTRPRPWPWPSPPRKAPGPVSPPRS